MEPKPLFPCALVRIFGNDPDGLIDLNGRIPWLQKRVGRIAAAVQLENAVRLHVVGKLQKRFCFLRHGRKEIIVHDIYAIVIEIPAQKAGILNWMHHFTLGIAAQRAVRPGTLSTVAQILSGQSDHGFRHNAVAPVGICNGHDDKFYAPCKRKEGFVQLSRKILARFHKRNQVRKRGNSLRLLTMHSADQHNDGGFVLFMIFRLVIRSAGGGIIRAAPRFAFAAVNQRHLLASAGRLTKDSLFAMRRGVKLIANKPVA